MTQYSPIFALAAAAFALAACNAEKGTDAAPSSSGPIAAVPAPEGGDWTTIVTTTPEGGFLMGNPQAPVKLVEFGSMTCPHCADFDEEAIGPLTENYVKSGRVSFEFRNFVRDPYDMAAAVVARCGGPSSFFGLTRQLFADQSEWIGKVQAADQATMQALGALPPNQQLAEVARLAGFPQWAAMRGLPTARTAQCLADPDAPTRLVQMQSDAVAAYKIPGTPSFLLNGKLVETEPGSTLWTQLDAKLKAALGG